MSKWQDYLNAFGDPEDWALQSQNLDSLRLLQLFFCAQNLSKLNFGHKKALLKKQGFVIVGVAGLPPFIR